MKERMAQYNYNSARHHIQKTSEYSNAMQLMEILVHKTMVLTEAEKFENFVYNNAIELLRKEMIKQFDEILVEWKSFKRGLEK
jgi:hypothetical protein